MKAQPVEVDMIDATPRLDITLRVRNLWRLKLAMFLITLAKALLRGKVRVEALADPELIAPGPHWDVDVRDPAFVWPFAGELVDPDTGRRIEIRNVVAASESLGLLLVHSERYLAAGYGEPYELVSAHFRIVDQAGPEPEAPGPLVIADGSVYLDEPEAARSVYAERGILTVNEARRLDR